MLLSDQELLDMKNKVLLAQQEVVSQLEYHRATDGTDDSDEYYYDKHIKEYQNLIDAINAVMYPSPF